MGFALSTLEGEARKIVMLLSKKKRRTFDHISQVLHDVYGDMASMGVQKTKQFFAHYQKEAKTLT